MELVNLPLIKSALPVSIPGFALSNLKHAKHYFQTTLNSVTLSAVGYTGCVHHNGPFLKRTNHELHSAEFFHDSSETLRHRHLTRQGDPKRVRISPSPLINTTTASRNSLAIDWPLSQHYCAGFHHDLVTNGLVFQITNQTDQLIIDKISTAGFHSRIYAQQLKTCQTLFSNDVKFRHLERSRLHRLRSP